MNENTKTCPFCGEVIMSTAKKCKHCGEWLNKETKDYNKKVSISIWMITLAIVLFIPMPMGMACFIGVVGGVLQTLLKKKAQE